MSKCCDTECENAPAPRTACADRPSPSPSMECPIDCATEFWTDSFFQAMRQTQVELLKAKIQKAWGPMIDKAAEAFLESMGAFWQLEVAKIRSAEACHGFKEKLRDIWLEEKKK